MHPAMTRETSYRLPLAPALSRLGPLAGTPVVREIPAGADHVAVNRRCRGGANLAADSGNCGLLEKGEPFVGLPLREKDDALLVEAEGLKVAVGQTGADVQCGGRLDQCLLYVTLIEIATRSRACQVTMCRALGRVPEKALGAAGPTP